MRQDKQQADAAAAAEAERARLALYAPVGSELSGLVLEVVDGEHDGTATPEETALCGKRSVRLAAKLS